jgi:hypothetical protein
MMRTNGKLAVLGRSAIGGALTGVMMAGVLGAYLTASASAPGRIEADAFAAYLDRSAPVSASIAQSPAVDPSRSVALNR